MCVLPLHSAPFQPEFSLKKHILFLVFFTCLSPRFGDVGLMQQQLVSKNKARLLDADGCRMLMLDVLVFSFFVSGDVVDAFRISGSSSQ